MVCFGPFEVQNFGYLVQFFTIGHILLHHNRFNLLQFSLRTEYFLQILSNVFVFFHLLLPLNNYWRSDSFFRRHFDYFDALMNRYLVSLILILLLRASEGLFARVRIQYPLDSTGKCIILLEFHHGYPLHLNMRGSTSMGMVTFSLSKAATTILKL